MDSGLFQLVLLVEDHSDIEEGLGEIRFDANRLTVTSQRRIKGPHVLIGPGQVVMRLVQKRFQTQGALVAGDGFGKFPLLAEDVPQVVIGFRKIGFESQRFFVVGSRRLDITEFFQRPPKLLCASANVGRKRIASR